MRAALSEVFFFIACGHLWAFQKRDDVWVSGRQFLKPKLQRNSNFIRFYLWRSTLPPPHPHAGGGFRVVRAGASEPGLSNALSCPSSRGPGRPGLLGTFNNSFSSSLLTDLDCCSSFSPSPCHLNYVQKKEISTIIIRNETKIMCHHQTPLFSSRKQHTESNRSLSTVQCTYIRGASISMPES